MCQYCESLFFFVVIDDFGNEFDALCIQGEFGPRAVLNAIYFAYPTESYYWGVCNV